MIIAIAALLVVATGPVAAAPNSTITATDVSGNDTELPDNDLFDAAEIAVDLTGGAPGATPLGGPTVRGQRMGGGNTIELPFDAEFVIVQWDGDPSATFALASRGPSGWSEAIDLGFEVVDGPDVDVNKQRTEGPAVAVLAAGPVWTGWGTTAVRLEVLSGTPTDVRIEALRSKLDRPDDPSTWTVEPKSSTKPKSGRLSGVGAAVSVADAGVVSRAQWGAMPWASANPGCGTTPLTSAGVDLMVVHHTASNNTYSQADAISQVRAIQRYHVVTLQWCDVGYNFLVDRYGTIYEGRQGSMTAAVRGSHASGFNTATMGISMLGQYHPGAQPTASTVPTVQLDAMVRIITALGRRWNINPADQTTYAGRALPVVVGHRDVNATSCPGDYAYPLLANMRVNVATTDNDPFGNFEQLSSPAPGVVAVTGWTIDPDTASPADIHVYANGAFAAVGKASLARPDVGAVYPASGPNHGFSVTFGLSPGRQQVCVYAINIPPGILNPALGCRTIDVAVSTSPFGSLDSLSAPGPGQARVRGWAIDPDTVDPISVHIYTNGAYTAAVTAERLRGDVGAAYPSFGSNHGYDTVVPVPGGQVQVCAYAINVGAAGVNTALGCRTLQAPTGNPFGNYEALTVVGRDRVRVQGWAIDPDTADSVTMHVYSNGRFLGAVGATGARSDVGAAFPAYGANHGFDATLAVPDGRAEICVFALNIGGGNSNTVLGCGTVVLGSGNPFGSFDALTYTGPGQLRVQGWAIDPDTTDPIAMHVYVNGLFAGSIAASQPRLDVFAVFPAFGPNQGFDAAVAVTRLPADVCVFALNAGVGTANTLLGCRQV